VNDERMAHYSEIIIDHSQFPRCHGTLDQPTHCGQGENPFCGDRVNLQLLVDGAGLITDVAVESVGCAISTASASLLAANLKGLSLDRAERLFDQVRSLITEGLQDDSDDKLGELAALAFAGRYPSRVKCATLAWHVLKHALAKDGSVATTE
jgi:nitrogen fixation NifU-like protein